MVTTWAVNPPRLRTVGSNPTAPTMEGELAAVRDRLRKPAAVTGRGSTPPPSSMESKSAWCRARLLAG